MSWSTLAGRTARRWGNCEHRKLFINKDEIQPNLLEFNLQAAKAKDPVVRVQLQADDGVNYGEVARAMASIERAGITTLSVITAR
ncbi:protein TolR [Pseudomonas sp. 58 R 12]|nr:protein TolR [Pseudomonas sp. 58 R 12]